MLRSKCINKDRKQKNHSGFSVFLLYGLEYSPNFTSGVTTVFNNDRDNSAGLGVGSDQEYAETAGGKSIPVDGVSARYVRLYTSGSSANIYNHYVEVEVMVPGSGGSGSDPGDPPDDPPDDPPVPGTNVALGKSVTSSIGQLGTVMTDGDKNTYNYQGVHEGLQWVQIDLGQIHTINMIKIWHYFGDGRKYRDVIVRASNSSNFSSGVVTLFNNDNGFFRLLRILYNRDERYEIFGQSIPR